MLIEVDFNSDEAIYVQLCNQIILGIATSVIREGDSLPSVRQLADMIGVNMHTVNKAYSVLKREGYISLDKRRGAVISLDIDKMEQLEEMRNQLRIVLARGCCKNISRQEVHNLVEYRDRAPSPCTQKGVHRSRRTGAGSERGGGGEDPSSDG